MTYIGFRELFCSSNSCVSFFKYLIVVISYFLVSMAIKGSIFSPILDASAVITSEKLVTYPCCTQASKSASIAFVAQTGNAFVFLSHSSGPWILDFGASDHLFGNKDIFSSLTFTSPLPMVTLANGSQTIAKGIGSACPLPSPPLTSVLYVPDSFFNLISISKLTRDLNCLITFSDHSITLQDRSTGQTIGIGRESQGLFHLSSPSSSTACASMDTSLLIHNRLGHPNISKLQKMVPHFSSLSSIECESCQLGKHTRISFPKCLDRRTKSPFELVHTNI